MLLYQIENLMKSKGRQFMWNQRLGYLCACPSNIGTGLRASVHIQLHGLCKVPMTTTHTRTRLSYELCTLWDMQPILIEFCLET